MSSNYHPFKKPANGAKLDSRWPFFQFIINGGGAWLFNEGADVAADLATGKKTTNTSVGWDKQDVLGGPAVRATATTGHFASNRFSGEFNPTAGSVCWRWYPDFLITDTGQYAIWGRLNASANNQFCHYIDSTPNLVIGWHTGPPNYDMRVQTSLSGAIGSTKRWINMVYSWDLNGSTLFVDGVSKATHAYVSGAVAQQSQAFYLAGMNNPFSLNAQNNYLSYLIGLSGYCMTAKDAMDLHKEPFAPFTNRNPLSVARNFQSAVTAFFGNLLMAIKAGHGNV